MQQPSRLKWNPKHKVSNKKLRKEREARIKELTLKGTPNVDIANDVGLTTQQVWNIQNELVKDGELERDPNTKRLKIAKQKIVSNKWEKLTQEPFAELPEIQKLIAHFKSKYGNELPQRCYDVLGQILAVCNTVNISPDYILNYKDAQTGEAKHLDKLTEVMVKFDEHLQAGTVVYKNPKLAAISKLRGGSEKISLRNYLVAMAALFDANQKTIPRGYGGSKHILSRKKTNYKQYAELQLSDSEKNQLLDFVLKETHSIQQQALTALQFEAMTRTESLNDWVNNIKLKTVELEDGNQYEYAEFKIYESKTKKDWVKKILDPVVLNIVRQLRTGEKPFALKPIDLVNYRNVLRKFYVSLGKLDPAVLYPFGDKRRKIYPQKSEEHYLDVYPAYTLRHSGAHLWMRRTGYHAEIVASMGWEDTATLVGSYASVPSEYMFQQNICYYCRPPNNRDTTNMHFCNAGHALIYLNNGHQAKKEASAKEAIDTLPDLESAQKIPVLVES